jgi:hypothetical protein
LAGTCTGNVNTSRGSPACAARVTIASTIDAGVSRRTGCAQRRQCRVDVRANSSLRWSLTSVIVPTVEREVRTGLVWSIAIAGGTPSMRSTLGLSIRSRNWRA